MGKKKTHNEFVSEVKVLHPGLIIRSKYIDALTPMDFTCEYGHDFSMRPNNILGGQYCNDCFRLQRSDKVRKGKVNGHCLWDTHPEIASHLKNPEDGYKYSIGSKASAEFICCECGQSYWRQIHHIDRSSFTCNLCSDGISFPNKLIYEVVSLTDAKNVEPEWCPEWLKPNRFDLYFEYNNKQYIVEMDGGLGHGNRSYSSKENNTDGLTVDMFKDELAKQHNIDVIRIDADYGNNEKCEFLKNQILNSKISQILSLSDIDWTECFKKSSSSMIVKVSELYNKGMSGKEILKIFPYSYGTILKWLKQGSMLGLCKYDKHEMRMRGCKKISVNQYAIDDIFLHNFTMIKDAADKNTISTTAIRYGLFKENHISCGYKWYFADDPTQPDPTKIITQQNY